MELADELMFDVDVDLEADDAAGPGSGARRRNTCRPRFLPRPTRAEAYIGKVDDRIKDTHLQHSLKGHPSA